MTPERRNELKKLFAVHVDPRGVARLERILRVVARMMGAVARLAGGGRRGA